MFVAGDDRVQAMAIMLDLVQPAIAHGRLRRGRSELESKAIGQRIRDCPGGQRKG
jgi:hypothetical protein